MNASNETASPLKMHNLQVPHVLLADVTRNVQHTGKWVASLLADKSENFSEYRLYIENEKICTLLDKNPIIWTNIRQKMKSYFRKIKSVSKPEDEERLKKSLKNDIINIFLLPPTKQTEAYPSLPELEKLIQSEFLENSTLHGLIENTPYSFVEQPIDILSQLDKMKKKWKNGVNEDCLQIESVIKKALDRNFFWSGTENSTDFMETHRAVIYYLESIFWLNVLRSISALDLRQVKNSDNLNAITTKLARVLRNGMWGIPAIKTSKWKQPLPWDIVAGMYMKWLFAWWYLPRIRNQREKAKDTQNVIFSKLDAIFWPWNDRNLNTWPQKVWKWEFSDDENTHKKSRTYTIEHNNKSYVFTVNSRIKSLRSILTKLFSDDNYNDVDSLLDLLGFNIILWAKMPEEVRAQVAIKIAGMLAKNSYIMKNKGLFWEKSLKLVKDGLKENPPLVEKSDKKTRSGQDYKDAKFAWYISESEVGIEVQLFESTEDPNPLGEAHHSLIEAGRAIQGWCRGVGFITWNQADYAIRQECLDEHWQSKSWLPLNEIRRHILNRNLAPYIIRDEEGVPRVIFAFKWYEHLLFKKYTQAQEVGDTDKGVILQTIANQP